MGVDTQSETDNAPEDAALRGARLLLHLCVFSLVLALYPYATNPAAPIKNLLGSWLAVAIALLYAVAMLRGATRASLPRGTLAVAAAFLGIHLLSALANAAPMRGLLELCPWILGLVLAIFAANLLRAPRHAYRFLTTICVAVALSSVYGFLQHLGLDPFPWSTRGIEEYIGMPSTYANPNFAGHTLLLALIITVGLLLRGKKGWWLFLPCAALIAPHLVLTHMRGARVALLAAFFFTAVLYLLLRRGARPVRATTALIAATLLLGGACIIGGLTLVSTSSDTPLPLDGASVLRLNGYYGAARMALDRPLFGFGPGSYDIENPRYWTPYEQQWFATENKKNDHVHNDLLETAADGGLPAAALYLAMLLTAILAAIRLAAGAPDDDRRRLGWILAACFVAFAVDGLFGFNLRVPVSAMLFFLLLGILQGQAASPVASRAAAIITATLLLILALAAAAGSTAIFRKESILQQARGAQVYGKTQRENGNPDNAKLGYEAGIRLALAASAWQPYDARCPEIAAQCAMALARFEEADQYLSQALAAAPNNPALHAMQAQARSSAMFLRNDLDVYHGQPDPVVHNLSIAATSAAERAVALCPDYPAANDALGRIYAVRADHEPAQRNAHLEKARACLERALRHGARGRADLNKRIADLCEALDDEPAAEAAFRRAAETAPDDESLWDRFAAFASRTGRATAYIKTLEQRAAHADPPLRDDLNMRLAFFLAFNQHNTRQARAIALETTRRAPGNPAAWGLLFLTTPGHTIAALQELLATSKSSAAPAWLTALAASPKQSAFLDAVRDTRDAIPGGLNASAASRGYLWAAKLIENALPGAELTDADAAQTRLALAEIFSRCGRNQDALRNANSAAPRLKDTDRAQALVLAAEALAQMNRAPEALQKARDAVRLAPAKRSVRHVLARLLLDQGALAEARFEYASLVKAPPPGEEAAVAHEADVLAARLAAQAPGDGA